MGPSSNGKAASRLGAYVQFDSDRTYQNNSVKPEHGAWA